MELFSKRIFPIAESLKTDGDNALRLLKSYSPLLSHKVRNTSFKDLNICREAVTKLCGMIDENVDIRTVVQYLIDTNLLEVDDVIAKSASLNASDFDNENNIDDELFAWTKTMDFPIKMMKTMDDYLCRRTRYDTHQGVKGLEFDRVMVIIDDDEAKGFMFSYNKLFGVKELSETDRKNASEGKETSIEHTTRLLYVTCTRAKKSLAVVIYTTEPEKVKMKAIEREWFSEKEISLLG